MWVSAVSGSGRRAVILRARMMVRIEASVHEREGASFFSNDQQNVQERMAHLHVSRDGQTFHLKVYGCSRMELEQQCLAPKRCRCVMLGFCGCFGFLCGLFGSEAV